MTRRWKAIVVAMAVLAMAVGSIGAEPGAPAPPVAGAPVAAAAAAIAGRTRGNSRQRRRTNHAAATHAMITGRNGSRTENRHGPIAVRSIECTNAISDTTNARPATTSHARLGRPSVTGGVGVTNAAPAAPATRHAAPTTARICARAPHTEQERHGDEQRELRGIEALDQQQRREEAREPRKHDSLEPSAQLRGAAQSERRAAAAVLRRAAVPHESRDLLVEPVRGRRLALLIVLTPLTRLADR
jgi:hypothetical protein